MANAPDWRWTMLLLLTLLSGCGGERITHDPARAVLGRWQVYSRTGRPSIQLIFAPRTNTGEGKLYYIDPVDNYIDTWTYRILDTNPPTRLDLEIKISDKVINHDTLLFKEGAREATWLRTLRRDRMRQRMVWLNADGKPDKNELENGPEQD